MQNSSSSTAPSIKAQHRIAKRRPIRRRRVDLNCGCSIFFHVSCAGHGFTHRGQHHCGSGREFRFYLGGAKSPLFQDHQDRGSNVLQDKDLPRPDKVQPQPQEEAGSSQSLPELPSLDQWSDSFWADLFN
ncbi:transcriptional activator protein [Corchorus yellow vein Cuba virus]|uniref:Transcriptional activator protein n=2 Tax=Begomovirus TaxID=10814 RepID=A0A6J3YJ29_9GEMI|nr:transcriptional activator protein [Corchorus yellow vein Cuba virus]AXU39872.1 transcriptional activator protein [Corchorus yellow vein virus]AXU39867.1 transcriptional activator protein [Corchorus yellow vein Cuba virus]AXU39877.1 transcriptional activator protein [Corchorus yellow vein virus]AXU39882.1 transcriptional activator protein [Corchorus yellow vein virus]AXU39887.1 transcriptional activator protein [Corchorus yellow vein virus]